MSDYELNRAIHHVKQDLILQSGKRVREKIENCIAQWTGSNLDSIVNKIYDYCDPHLRIDFKYKFNDSAIALCTDAFLIRSA